MKKELKGFVAGVLLSSLIVSAVPTMAEKVTRSAELLYNDIKVVIDGKRADLKDANGNTVEPFIVDGTTYLPVRAVANALDKAVSWDGATQTVYLGKNDEIEQPSVWLKDLETFTETARTMSVDGVEFGGSAYNNYLTANTGKVFDNCWSSGSPKGVTYLLGYKYSKFNGTVYLTNSSKSMNEFGRYLVYGDNKLLYTSDDMTAGSMPCDFSVNVSNVNVLKIVYQQKDREEYSYRDTDDYNHLGVGNAGLYE